MPVYAAVDIGSNSCRMLTVRVEADGTRKVLAADREVTRLGESVFRAGAVSQEAMELVCSVLNRFSNEYGRFAPSAIRAVATAAIRDTSNQEEFVARASTALGAPVEIISGQEEARLIHQGVQSAWPHPNERLMIVDVGGGSAEIIISEKGRIKHAHSKPLGAVRLTGVFLKNDPPKPKELGRMQDFIDEKLAPVVSETGTRPCDRAIATSATAGAMVGAVAGVDRGQRDEADRLSAGRGAVRKLYNELIEMDTAARARVTGIGPRRAQIIVPGVAVLLRCMELFKLPELFYSTAGVRDGIIADLRGQWAAGEAAGMTAEQRTAVETMASRYGVALPHASAVASFCMALFHSLAAIHGLTPYWARILEAAAWLYDVGHFISDNGHHRHAEYVVAHSDLPGFTDREKRLVSMLCRFHRKSMPGNRHHTFQELPAEDRRALLWLIPLLRLGDALDFGKEQRVAAADCTVADRAVVLRVVARGGANTDLEQWACENTAAQFEDVYGRPLAVTGSNA